jgi:hypothetical protein
LEIRVYESLGGIITTIALVKKPAVGINYIADEDTKTVYGTVMSANVKMFRKVGINGRQEDCYWFFSQKTIDELRKNYIINFPNGNYKICINNNFNIINIFI